MSKGNRNKEKHKNEEMVKALVKIIESSELTKGEKKVVFSSMFMRGRIKNICRNVYGFEISKQTKMFKKTMYNLYGINRALKDFSDFHLMGITKCRIMDNNWENFLTADGRIKRHNGGE